MMFQRHKVFKHVLLHVQQLQCCSGDAMISHDDVSELLSAVLRHYV